MLMINKHHVSTSNFRGHNGPLPQETRILFKFHTDFSLTNQPQERKVKFKSSLSNRRSETVTSCNREDEDRYLVRRGIQSGSDKRKSENRNPEHRRLQKTPVLGNSQQHPNNPQYSNTGSVTQRTQESHLVNSCRKLVHEVQIS